MTGVMDQEMKERIVAMYQAVDEQGDQLHRLSEIEQATGTSRSTIYYVLDQAGIARNRQRRPDETELGRMLGLCENERTRLQLQVRDLRDQLDRANRLIDKLT